MLRRDNLDRARLLRENYGSFGHYVIIFPITQLLTALAAHITTGLGSLGRLRCFGLLVLLRRGCLLVLRPAVRDEQRVVRVTGRLQPFRLLSDSLHLLVALRRLRVWIAVLDVAAALGGWRR